MNLEVRNIYNIFLPVTAVASLKIVINNDTVFMNAITDSRWCEFLDCVGKKYFELNITGVVGQSVNDLLLNYAMENILTEYRIKFDSGKIFSAKCVVKRYEIFYKPSEFDEFELILFSSGVMSVFSN